MPFETQLLTRWWLGAVLMAAVAVSDLALTLWGARLYRRASAYVAVEGSYEMVPMFQSQVDAGRLVSFRFIGVLLALVAVMAFAADIGGPLYLFIAGSLLLVEVPIHLRHATNIINFSLLPNAGAAVGRITYARWFTLKVGAAYFFAFGILFLIAAWAASSWLALGGAARCLIFGGYCLWLSSRARVQSPPAPVPEARVCET